MIIVDIGAFDGKSFTLPLANDKANLVYAIEPNPELANKIKSYNLPNIRVFSLAMGEGEGTIEFYLNQNDQTSSLLKNNCIEEGQNYKEKLTTINTINVKVMRLDTFIEQNQIPEIDLLKIDAKGANFQVLKGAGKYLNCIKKIIIEVQLKPIRAGISTKEGIVNYLNNRGFCLVNTESQTEGLKENLEFIRINRYHSLNNNSSFLEVKVPYLGTMITPHNDHVGQLLARGVFEGPEQAFLWLYLKPEDVFFDCGSHVGIFSLIAAKRLNNQGKIVGFDPNPICYELYNSNLKNHGCNCFTSLNIGLSDSQGQSEFLLGKEGMSAFSTFAKGASEHNQISQEKLTVQQNSLDNIVTELNIKEVALAKLDVEGWETIVLQGAQKSIKQKKFPLWMIEFTETNAIAANSSTKELRQLLESFGYTICRFDASNFRLIPEPFKEYYYYDNLFAVMDLEVVNKRLSSAETNIYEIAKDIVSRWDLAMIVSETQQALSQEKQISKEHRKWAEKSDTLLTQERQISQELRTWAEKSDTLLTQERQISQELRTWAEKSDALLTSGEGNQCKKNSFVKKIREFFSSRETN